MSDVKRRQGKSKLVNNIKIGFIADDIKNLSSFGVFHNTTFGLMLAAQELGTKVLLTESNNFKIINNKVFAKFDEVLLKEEVNTHLMVKGNVELQIDSLDIIFARKDPPINNNYLSYVHALSLVTHSSSLQFQGGVKSKVLIINNPQGILKSNEKLYPLMFPSIVPPTIVTASKEQVFDFVREHKEAVIKPLFNKGGEGVFYLNIDNINLNSIIESSLAKENIVLVQKYLPEIVKGDKRIILLNGKVLGGIRRIPKSGEFRAHISRGASFKPIELSKNDLLICEMLKPSLEQDGLYFVAIDIISDYLIEVNFTCPANLREVGEANNKDLSREVVNWAVEKAVGSKAISRQ